MPTRDPDAPSLPPVSVPLPELGIVPPSAESHRQNPFSVEDVGLGYMSMEDDGGQRESSVLHHYPSSSEVDRFDFSGPGQRRSQALE